MSRILIAASRNPWPPHRGDQARALQVAELLAADRAVTLLVPAPVAGGAGAAPAGLPFRVETYARRQRAGAGTGLARAFLARLPLQSGLFWNPALGQALRRLAPEHDLVILQLVRLASHLPDLAGTPVLVDLVDSLALSTGRRAGLDRRPLRPLLRLESRWLARWERRLVLESAGAMVVSRRDRDAIAGALPAEARGLLHVVPLAVPAAPAPPAEAAAAAGSEGPPVLAITGNLGYFPTREGLTWFLERVWPELCRRRPELRLLAAGARPGRRLRGALRGAGARLEEAPPDLRPVLARARVALAPMRGGAGQPMKIVEAWAAGVPVVATPWAAAGTTAEPGTDLLVAEDVEGWCRAILALVDDPALRARLAASAHARLLADYSPEGVRRRLGAAVAAALAAAAVGRPAVTKSPAPLLSGDP